MSASQNQVAPIAKFRQELMAMTPEFANALPSHIKPEKFQRVLLTVVQLQPDLLNCDRRSLFASCIKCAADGLIPDGREAALVKFGNAVTYMPMFTGIQKRVRNSGEITSIQSHVIYEHDTFVWRQGTDASVEHVPLFPGDRGKPIGVYAIAKFKDGSDPQIEVMDWAQVEKIRKSSKSANSGPWVQWAEEMARKSCFRRLAKWLPLDADVDTLMRRDDEISDAPAPPPPVTAPTIEADAFEAASAGGMPETHKDQDTETATDLAAQFTACATVEEIQSLSKHPAVVKRMSAWREARPELYQTVDEAAAARMKALEGEGE